MEIKAQPLFPSLVWSTVFEDRERFNAELLTQARQLRERDPQGVSKTNQGGWQSNNNLQDLPEFDAMNTRIIQACQRIAESQHFAQGLNFYHQAWVNISPPGASNQVHFHANCHFSGVYYLSLKAPECGSIYFRDPRVASRMMPYPTTQQTGFTASEVRMPPEEGRLYIFPGWLEHGVEVNQSQQDRISISFNVLASPQ
ncbi:MAG: TIGR02466 family protein [Gammaproteobacteria bacterium]|jgi:uncharacterized protein (TIGR02466 family)|nr:TIGR02466 family protein [Gammaproteobacteria bacterium]